MTLSEEDYIKAIYHLGKGENRLVATNELSGAMDTKLPRLPI